MKIAYLMYFDHDKANEIAAIVNELIKQDDHDQEPGSRIIEPPVTEAVAGEECRPVRAGVCDVSRDDTKVNPRNEANDHAFFVN